MDTSPRVLSVLPEAQVRSDEGPGRACCREHLTRRADRAGPSRLPPGASEDQMQVHSSAVVKTPERRVALT
jgi:hypothetical protein